MYNNSVKGTLILKWHPLEIVSAVVMSYQDTKRLGLPLKILKIEILENLKLLSPLRWIKCSLFVLLETLQLLVVIIISCHNN